MLMQRKAKLTINNVVIDYDTYDFNWNYTNKNDDKPSFFNISIPNLTKNFKSQIKKGDAVIFEFGFDDISDTLITGIVDKKDEKSFNSVTNYLELKIMEIQEDAFKNINKSYSNSVKSSYIIRDLALLSGFSIQRLQLKNDVVQENGYVCYGKALNLINKLVELCGSNINTQGNELYIYDKDVDSKTDVFILGFDSGLLQEPREAEIKQDEYSFSNNDQDYNYILTALANPNIRKNSVIKINTKNLKSYTKVVEYNIDNWVAEYYVKVMGA